VVANRSHGRPAGRRAVGASANGGQVRDQGVEVGEVVEVRGRDMRHQRHPARIGHDVVFGPRLAAIGWVRSSFFSPAHRADRPAVHHRPALVEPSPSAQLGEEGLMQATPDSGPFHSTKRRQHVLPEPHPISLGSICHGNPPHSTNRMPVRPRARRPAAVRRGAAHGDGASEATARDAPTAHRPRGAVPCATVTKSTAQVQEISQRF
jgi:hypothetical protein